MEDNFTFGRYELNLRRRELRREGRAVVMQAKVFDLLAYLVEHRDRVVEKDDLIAAVWPGSVVTDAVLTSAVRKARLALEDHHSPDPLIKTVHGHGYRFVGSVQPLTPSAAPSPGDTAPVSRPSIAVLRFATVTDDTDQAFLAEAIAADITTLLAKHRWLEVIGRHAVRRALEENDGRDAVARAALADYLVSGTIRRTGKRLRVTAELDDGRSGRHLWGDIYDRQVEDVFDVQDEITRMVVGRLEAEIGIAERHRAARVQRPDLQAWECFHLALMHFYRFTADDDAEARRLLQRSRELDPGFGEAHAWWAYATVLGMVYWNQEPSAGLLDEALDAVQQALDVDDQNAVFFAIKARVQLARREYGSAITENRMAIQLNPTLALAHCSLGDSLAYEARYDDAIVEFERALTLSPNDPQRWAFLSYGALALLFKGDLEQSLRWAEQALELPNCQYWARAHKVVALAHLGRREDAHRASRMLLAVKPEFSVAFARRKLFYLKREDQISLYLSGLTRAGVAPC